MTTAAPSTALATIRPAFTDPERLALAGFLAGYRALTREAYALDLRQFTTWCRARALNLFAVRRADIESFARELEARGRARATVTRRLCTIAGFYRYAVEEELPDHSPAAHLRRPRADYESHAVALGRNELGALLVGGRARPADRACADLATGPERTAGLRGHRRRHRAPRPRTRTPDADDHAKGRQGRHHSAGAAHRPGDGPGHRRAHGWAGAPGRGRTAARPARRRQGRPQGRPPSGHRQAGYAPHTLRHAFITAALDAGVPLRDVQEAASHADPRTTMRYDRARGSLDRHATYIVTAYVAGAPR